MREISWLTEEPTALRKTVPWTQFMISRFIRMQNASFLSSPNTNQPTHTHTHTLPFLKTHKDTCKIHAVFNLCYIWHFTQSPSQNRYLNIWAIGTVHRGIPRITCIPTTISAEIVSRTRSTFGRFNKYHTMYKWVTGKFGYEVKLIETVQNLIQSGRWQSLGFTELKHLSSSSVQMSQLIHARHKMLLMWFFPTIFLDVTNYLSHHSDYVTSWRTENSWFDSRKELRIFVFHKPFSPAPEPDQPPIQSVQKLFTHWGGKGGGVKTFKRKTNCKSPCIVYYRH
jgi:hypothetical protein